MKKAGIDIGSRTIKLAIVENSEVLISRKCENTFDTLNDCRKLLEGIEYDHITATGYGRHLFAEHFPDTSIVSEIKAFALGVHFFHPTCRTILDIGGQDTKAISIDQRGALRKFEMNDRCAAGTGRFLEIMSMALRTPLAEFGQLAEQATEPQKINNMCTVFAESEVISMLAKGVLRENIAQGILQSIMARSTAQLKRVGITEDLVFVGGVALNQTMHTILAQQTGHAVYSIPDPQIAGAVGAAISQG